MHNKIRLLTNIRVFFSTRLTSLTILISQRLIDIYHSLFRAVQNHNNMPLLEAELLQKIIASDLSVSLPVKIIRHWPIHCSTSTD